MQKSQYNTPWTQTSRKPYTAEYTNECVCICKIYNTINKYKEHRIKPSKICVQYLWEHCIKIYSKIFERPNKWKCMSS